jgi:hypothetical protein
MLFARSARHERRRLYHRRGHPPVRPHRRPDGPAIRASSRCARRSPTRASNGPTSSSPMAARRPGNADIMVNELGLTGVQFINVANGCATGGSAHDRSALRRSSSGECDLGLAVGFDKHPRGAFNAKPSDWGLPDWYGETGMMLTTQFFAMKIQRYMALHGISRRDAWPGRRKGVRNGTPVRRLAARGRRSRHDPERADGQRPADQVHVLLARRGRGRPGPGERKEGPRARADAVRIRERGRPHPPRRLVRGVLARPRTSRSAAAPSRPRPREPRRVRDGGRRPGGHRRWPSSRTPKAAPRSCTWPRTASAPTANRRPGSPRAGPEIDGALPINTDGGCLACGEPIGASGLRQVYENFVQLRVAGRRAAGSRRSAPRLQPRLWRARPLRRRHPRALSRVAGVRSQDELCLPRGGPRLPPHVASRLYPRWCEADARRVRRARHRPRVAPHPQRQGLGRLSLARVLRRHRLDADAALYFRKGMCGRGRAVAAGARAAASRPGDLRLRDAGAEGPLPAPIRAGTDYWCQGYSEPQSGSDLASLRTRAGATATNMSSTGQKIWTTHAHHANWIFCLVRTDSEVKKQAGISFMLMPMDSAGRHGAPRSSRWRATMRSIRSSSMARGPGRQPDRRGRPRLDDRQISARE